MFPKPKRLVNRKLLADVRRKPCCICWEQPGNKANRIEASHILTRGAGRPDTEFNVVPHCQKHHREWGRLGAKRFCERYPAFGEMLAKMGWIWIGSKLWHPDLKRPDRVKERTCNAS